MKIVTSKGLTLGQLIRIADKAYPDGKVLEAHKLLKKHGWCHGVAREVGDTLAMFVASGLAETFDPKASRTFQLDEAMKVVMRGQHELEMVLQELYAAWRRGTKPPAGMRCGRRNPN